MKNRRKSLWKVILIVVLAITVVAAGLFLTQNFWNTKPKDDPIEIPQTEDKIAVFHGAAPNCPERYCVSITVNGDLLFHPALWKNFATGDENEYDFDSLLAPMKQYYEKSDLAICDMETPLAKKGGNYTGYPIFNTPPQLATAAKNAGYDACTTDTNHSVDQGTAGVNRTIDTLESAGLKHTGSYKTEEESEQPLILDAEGGKVAIITGTNSLNGLRAEYDWQVDRMRDGAEREKDVARAVAMAKKAREQGANLVILQLHSIQEYLTYADSWQISAAHELADTGEFDFIYFHGSHSVQPLELYNDTYIAYGLGNAVTVSAPTERYVNNQGLTVRVQFASSDQKTWRVAKISYLLTFNKTGTKYAWCPLAADYPSGFCANESTDAQMINRMEKILFSRGVTQSDIVQPWLISEE